MYRSVGLNECARRTGIDKKTILRWGQEEGIDNETVMNRIRDDNRKRSIAAHARIQRERDEALERIMTRNLAIVEGAQARVIQLLRQGDRFGTNDLRALVDAFARATHDFQLLAGRPTERGQDNSTVVNTVMDAMAGALTDVGLTQEAQEQIRRAFAERMRAVAANDGPPELEQGDEEPEAA